MNDCERRYDERALWEECDEALFRAVMLRYEERDAERLENALNSGVGEVSEREISEAYARALPRFYKALDRGIAKARKTHARRAIPRAGRILAYALLACYLLGTVAVAASDRARVYLARFLISVEAEYTQLSLQKDENRFVDIPADWKGVYYPTWLPDGFELSRVTGNEMLCELSCENADGKMLFFQENGKGVEMNIDTESAEISYVDVNGGLALVAVKGGVSRVVWAAEDRYFVIEFDGGADDALRIARSTKRLK